MKFRNPDGEFCQTPAENAEVVKGHFDRLYNAETCADPSVLSSVKQRPIREELAREPSPEEVRRAFRKQKNDKSPGENKIPPEFWKALLEHDEVTASSVVNIVLSYWRSGEPPEEWATGLLKLLHKGGDTSDTNNWRGIMLLDSVVKVVGTIISDRLQDLLAEFGFDEQNGFMRLRGTCDGVFSLRLALQKRKEHGQATWAVFVDLIKAFDTVPRDMLLEVLAKLGVPKGLRDLISPLIVEQKVKIDVAGTEVIINATIGVKQGDSLSPVLFIMYMQAVMEVVNDAWAVAKPAFRTKNDDVTHGRKWNAKRGVDDFTYNFSLYADDGAFLFERRDDLVSGMDVVFNVFKRFGLMCHVYRGGPKKSKTEAMHFPANHGQEAEEDTSDFPMGGGTVHFTEKFKYLGSMISRNLSDEVDVDARIQKAGSAFGALRQSFFGSKAIPLKDKKIAYESIVLCVLLHGSESWALTKKLQDRLQKFHNRCVRTMCRVNRWHTWKKRISQENLEKRLGVMSMEQAIRSRQLRWAGHVMRMDYGRFPRKFISAWVEHPRRPGRPQFTYGHSLETQLRKASVDLTEWATLTQDREAWRVIVNPNKPKKSRR